MTQVDAHFAYTLLQALQLRGDTQSSLIAGRVKAAGLLNWQRREPTAFPVALLDETVLLQVLSDMACRQHRRANRQAAADLLEEAAARRGVSRDLLELSIVPPLALGEAPVDYGPRRFTLAMGDDRRPLLRGSRRAHIALPRPRAGDSPELTRQAAGWWKQQRPLLTWTLRAQAARLEHAMVEGRRWDAAVFAGVLHHPLLSELARRVVWGGYDADGALATTFSLADDLAPLGEDYLPVSLDGLASFGPPHPATVQPARRQRWGELLHDFHVAPLFPQATRPVFAPTDVEREQVRITRFANVQLRRGAVDGWLGGRGWERMPTETPTTFSDQIYSVRHFEGAGVTALLEVDGDWSDQWISGCRFVPGIVADEGPPAAPLALGQVDPIAFSETVWRLTELTRHPRLSIV